MFLKTCSAANVIKFEIKIKQLCNQKTVENFFQGASLLALFSLTVASPVQINIFLWLVVFVSMFYSTAKVVEGIKLWSGLSSLDVMVSAAEPKRSTVSGKLMFKKRLQDRLRLRN